MRKILLGLVVVIFCPILANAANYTAGKEYKLIPQTKATQEASKEKNNKVQVVEFFSYGCPWCFRFEPSLEKWLAKKPTYVNFQRVPVIFEAHWRFLAKAYYAADALGVAEKITPALFNAIQVKRRNLFSEQALADFFAEQGVNKEKFTGMFNFAPGIDAQVMRGQTLMKTYGVMAVPTVVVDGKYRVDPSMVGGNTAEMINVIDYLVKKSHG